MKLFKRFIWITVSLATAIVLITWVASPYRLHKEFGYRAVSHSVVINAPAERVFQYLGNSDNAARWSVFVNHITPLNPDKVSDGNIGSKRRCYTGQDERHAYWDETIVQVIPNVKRKLTIYNLQHFAIEPDAETLATEQWYKPLNVNQCELTFTFFFDGSDVGWLDLAKIYVVAFKVHPIFKSNMENIKIECERQYRKSQPEKIVSF